jgi:integrase
VKKIAVPEDLAYQVNLERSSRQCTPDEFLLYPVKLGRVGVYPDTRMGVIWEDRLSPLSLSGIDKWWRRMLRNAGVDPFPMHELRHSAGTNFWRETRDLRLTQKLMRHKSIRTTADTYLHDDASDLAEAMALLPAWEIES